MNIEIANRLVNLRKANNLSQEALAEKLGISRQAVSKWERAEASPDTDNLILLARLYGVSLDELLKTEDEIPMPEKPVYALEKVDAEQESRTEDDSFGGQEGYVHVGFQGVHVKDKDSEVHVGWSGIHVDDKKKDNNVHVDKNGVYINGKKYDKGWCSCHSFPMWVVISVLYIIIGVVWGAWHPGWLLFLFVPIWHSLLETVQKKNPNYFAYPVFVTLVFLCLGIFASCWHPGWVVFVTIPLYYSLIAWIRGKGEEKEREEDEE